MDKTVCVFVSNAHSTEDVTGCVEWLRDVIERAANSVGKDDRVQLENWDIPTFKTFLLIPSPKQRPVHIVVMIGEKSQATYDEAFCTGTNFERINLLRCVHSILHFAENDWRFKQLSAHYESMVANSVKNVLLE
jgi:hypothetical protein